MTILWKDNEWFLEKLILGVLSKFKKDKLAVLRSHDLGCAITRRISFKRPATSFGCMLSFHAIRRLKCPPHPVRMRLPRLSECKNGDHTAILGYGELVSPHAWVP